MHCFLCCGAATAAAVARCCRSPSSQHGRTSIIVYFEVIAFPLSSSAFQMLLLCLEKNNHKPFIFGFHYTAFYGSRKLRKKWKFANFFRNFPHVRSLWEQKVAKKVGKLSLSTIIARSGAKVCKLSALQMWQKKVARRKKYRFGVRQNHELFSRVTQPIQSVVHNHTRKPHTTHTTPNMDGHG